MAYKATRTTLGFELIGHLLGVPDNGREFELTPNTAFKAGDMVVLTNGKVAPATANAVNVLGVIAKTFTVADNPATGLTYGKVYTDPFNVYLCSFADQYDGTATGGTSTTLIDTSITTSKNDVWKGALLYIYEGPGKGDIRTISGFTHATTTLTVSHAFSETPTTATKYIILGAAANTGDAINVGSVGVDLKDARTIDGNATIVSEAGPLAVVDVIPEDLMMKVVIRKHLFNR